MTVLQKAKLYALKIWSCVMDNWISKSFSSHCSLLSNASFQKFLQCSVVCVCVWQWAGTWIYICMSDGASQLWICINSTLKDSSHRLPTVSSILYLPHSHWWQPNSIFSRLPAHFSCIFNFISWLCCLLYCHLIIEHIYSIQGGTRNVIPFYHPIRIVPSQYRCCKLASECCSSCKMRQMSPVCKMADNGAVDCRSKGESCIVLCRNKECSGDSETFSCTL